MPIQFKKPCQPEFTPSENSAVAECIKKLLAIGAIYEVQSVDDEFLSKIFPISKPDGSFRLIFNLKELNLFIKTEHFKLEDWRTARNLIRYGIFMSKIDLKDAYHLIPIHSESRKFLRFNWNNKLYEYCCLPFGLSTAPRIFTKIMRVVIKKLRESGNLSVIYLDDILLFGTNYNSCLKSTLQTKRLLIQLGFILSEKSELVPSQKIEYLGLNFDSIAMTISLPERKIIKIIQLCKSFQKSDFYSIQKIAEFLGLLVSATPAIKYSPLYTRQLEIEKTEALILNNQNFSSKMSLSSESLSDIAWWQAHANMNNNIISDNFDMIIETDASLTGWGANFNGISTRGHWTPEEAKLHINILELKAVENALQTFVKKSNSVILLRVDNTTAISYINKYGGCRNRELHKIAKRIWQWCEARNVMIKASYISSKDNFVADRESRIKDYQTDWKLETKCFNKACLLFGVPTIDLFANYQNTQLPRFVSYFPDPKSMAIDSFTISWSNEFFYAFPPFGLLPRVLRKIQDDKASGIVIAPNWSSQPWYPLYKSMSVSEIMIFGPNKQLLLCPFSGRSHPLNKTLQLMGSILSGNLLNQKD